MADLHQHDRPGAYAHSAMERRRASRRKRLMRRRIWALILMLLALVGLYFGLNWLVGRFSGKSTDPKTSETNQKGGASTPATPLPFKPDRLLPVSIAGEKPLQIAIGPSENFMRQVALASGEGTALKMIGEPIIVPDFAMTVVDLPRATGLLLLSGKRIADGPPESITVGGEPAVAVSGEEPDLRVWQPDPTRGLVPVDYYQLAAPLTPPEPTMLLVDKWLNVLWYYEQGELVQTARVATGSHIQGPAPTAANQSANYLTPVGRFAIANKHPGLTYWVDGTPAGDPQNPLGTRWMGFEAFDGDQGMVWAIHGTNQPDLIGRWRTKGTIWMLNQEIEALYERVTVGTPLQIISSQS